MDIRTVESIPTAGSLSDPAFRINPNAENVSLDYDYEGRDLALLDTNINYNVLPNGLGTGLVKKTFLTYNGISCETRQLIQTVVLESDSAPISTQAPGYNNSNGWLYKPAQFNLPGGYPTTSNPLDTANFPYDQSQGITVVKQFLGGESGLVPNRYTAYYRAPVQHSFELANAEGTKIYTDGWYTSYVIACKTYAVIDPLTNGIAPGQIVHYTDNNTFYINTTGTSAALEADPDNAGGFRPDSVNWAPAPTFEQWMAFLKSNMGPAMSDDPVYFAETQHLVTADLSAAIKSELLKISCCCDSKDFGMSTIDTWMKLTQKRMGAIIKFNDEIFKTAQEIIETTRATCYLCLYHDNTKLC